MTNNLHSGRRWVAIFMLVPRRGVLTLVLSMAIAPVSRATEDYYIWVDEAGVTNYGERPPGGVHAEHVTTPQTFGERIPTAREKTVDTLPSTTTGAASTVYPDELVREQREALEAEIARAKKKNCMIGRRNLENLTTHPQIRFTDANGDVQILPEEERQAKIKEARRIVQENCDG